LFFENQSAGWREAVTLINARIQVADVSDRCNLDHVPDSESLDGLVLCHCARAVGAAHEFDMAATFFVAAAVSSLLCL
jgi:hypothetical protein